MKKSFNTKKWLAIGGIVFNFFAIFSFFLIGRIDGMTVRETSTSDLMPILFFIPNVCLFCGLLDDDKKENDTDNQATEQKKKWGISEKIRFLLGLFCGIATMVVLLWFVSFIALQIF